MITYKHLTTAQKLKFLLDWFPILKSILFEQFLAAPDKLSKEALSSLTENTQAMFMAVLRHKAADIVQQRKDELERDNELFAVLFASADLQDYTISLVRDYANSLASLEHAKLREAVKLFFTEAHEELNQKALAQYQLFDQLQLLFNLFPQELRPFVDFMEEEAQRPVQNNSLKNLLEPAKLLLMIIQNHKAQICTSSFVFAARLAGDTPNPMLQKVQMLINYLVLIYADQKRRSHLSFYRMTMALFPLFNFNC